MVDALDGGLAHLRRIVEPEAADDCGLPGDGAAGGIGVVDAVSGMENAIEAKCDNLIDYNAVQPLYVKRSQAEEESC